jgi:hypothetical protein
MGQRFVALIVRWNTVTGFIAAMALVTLPALRRDVDGRYKESPLHGWFEHLASGKGLCCSYADGYVIEDADWESEDGHYRVRVPKAAGSKDWSGLMCRTRPSSPNRTRSGGRWYGLSIALEACRSAALCPGA